jgi:cytochrome bd-type quinol oxidase subunit 2
MPETEKSPQDVSHDFLYLTAVCLVVAVVLYILGAILSSTTFSGISARDRIELISEQSSNVFIAGLVLAAIVALFHVTPERAPQFRAVVIATLFVAGVIAVLAVYTVGDILSRHIPTDGSGSSISFGLSQGGTLRARLGGVLPHVGALLLALLAMFGANRIGHFVSGSRGTSDGPQDLWEDE